MFSWRKKHLAAASAPAGSTVADIGSVAPQTTATPKAGREDEKHEQKPPLPATTEVQVFTAREIEERIAQMSQPGSSVFFYLSGSPKSGGPLGRGAAVVELTPRSEKKQKKYVLYVDDVDGSQPAGRRQKISSYDNLKGIAGWIKDRQRRALDPGTVTRF